MRTLLGGCLGALVGLVAGVVLGAILIWILAQTTDLHGAPLDLYAGFVLLCILVGGIVGLALPEPSDRR